MYEVPARETAELFRSHLDGSDLPLLCILSGAPLPDRARSALASSARTLGYPDDAVAFITLVGPDGKLDASSVLLAMEGLDPACAIAADADAARTLAQAYRYAVPEGECSRVMGRSVVAFASFDALLDDDRSKQRAWALLKKLPKLGG